MIKILVVDDDQEKRRVVTEVALKVDGVDMRNVQTATDVTSAKRAIACTHFDLVILDINLPERQDCVVSVGAGLNVLRFIKNNTKAKPPAFVVGMTAYDDGAEAAAKEFSSPIWKLVRFSHSDDSWKEPLMAAIEYLNASKRPPYRNDGHSFHIDLAIIVALSEEADSIRAQGDGWRLADVPFDSTPYHYGEFRSEEASLKVVLAQAPRMGMPMAAVVATKVIHTFRPKVIAMAGICAGVRGKAELGDILIADPCFDWGSGKWLRVKETGGLKFHPAAYQWRLDESVRGAAQGLSFNTELLQSIHAAYDGDKPKQPPCVMIEAMASGASVLQASSLMADVREQHKNLVGVEMESYAVFTAAELAAEPRPTCISVKSVCDFGDETKNDWAHGYAAHTSAAFLRELALAAFAEVDD